MSSLMAYSSLSLTFLNPVNFPHQNGSIMPVNVLFPERIVFTDCGLLTPLLLPAQITCQPVMLAVALLIELRKTLSAVRLLICRLLRLVAAPFGVLPKRYAVIFAPLPFHPFVTLPVLPDPARLRKLKYLPTTSPAALASSRHLLCLHIHLQRLTRPHRSPPGQFVNPSSLLILPNRLVRTASLPSSYVTVLLNFPLFCVNSFASHSRLVFIPPRGNLPMCSPFPNMVLFLTPITTVLSLSLLFYPK